MPEAGSLRRTPSEAKFSSEQSMPVKPLFIPLRTKWYRAFEAGDKIFEYRAYGPRWNERTCFVGRPAIISHGYGKRERLSRMVHGFKALDHAEAPDEARAIYPDATYIAKIELR